MLLYHRKSGEGLDNHVNVIKHPLVQDKLALLRNTNTNTATFRSIVNDLSMLLFYEATSDLKTTEIKVQTPCGVADCQTLQDQKLTIVPIIRAGLGMVDGALNLFPDAVVGHIGLYRNEKTLEPVEYFCKLPSDISERDVFIVDPMLATGGSAVDAISQIKKRNPHSIKFLCIISAPEGLKIVREAHPDVPIYTACIDEKLNENGYIVPGLGDAGDRIFGTK